MRDRAVRRISLLCARCARILIDGRRCAVGSAVDAFSRSAKETSRARRFFFSLTERQKRRARTLYRTQWSLFSLNCLQDGGVRLSHEVCGLFSSFLFSHVRLISTPLFPCHGSQLFSRNIIILYVHQQDCAVNVSWDLIVIIDLGSAECPWSLRFVSLFYSRVQLNATLSDCFVYVHCWKVPF